MAIFGIGLGMNMQSLVLAMQNAVPAKDMGVASAASSFFRSIGGTLGTAIFLSILFSEAGTKIAQQYAGAAHDPAYIAAAKANPGQVASLQQHLSGGLSDTSFLSGLAKPLAHPFFVGFSSRPHDVVSPSPPSSWSRRSASCPPASRKSRSGSSPATRPARRPAGLRMPWPKGRPRVERRG